MRESRPSGMRAVHQAPPALATRVTTSPSPTPLWRKAATAPRARSAWVGERWMSSNTTAKLRPRRLSGTTFVETTVRRCAARGARDLGHHDRLEAGERLLDTVLGDDEVVAGEPADGLALLVHDRDVDGHELDLRLERGLGRRWRCLRRPGGRRRGGRGRGRGGRGSSCGHRLSPGAGPDQGEGAATARAPSPFTRNDVRSQARLRPGAQLRHDLVAAGGEAPRGEAHDVGDPALGVGRRQVGLRLAHHLGVVEELERDLRGLRLSRGHVRHEEEADSPGSGPPPPP